MINFTDYSIEMWDDEKIASFRRTLLAWYDNEKRDLPWRRTKNPYHIWVSEIMLQQTQVVTVIPYYERFLAWFPTVDALAKAPEEKLLKAWEGLGYYSRVRNMQKAAQEIMDDFNGEFPSTYDDILSLKGIGPYTLVRLQALLLTFPNQLWTAMSCVLWQGFLRSIMILVTLKIAKFFKLLWKCSLT